jgi:hypothetical protein
MSPIVPVLEGSSDSGVAIWPVVRRDDGGRDYLADQAAIFGLSIPDATLGFSSGCFSTSHELIHCNQSARGARCIVDWRRFTTLNPGRNDRAMG